MTKVQKTLILIFLILGALTWFFVEISGILLPFVLAFILAYFLHPSVTYLEKRNCSRSLASVFITFLFCFFIIAVFLIFVPILQAQILALMVKIPQLVDVLWLKIQTLILYTKENMPQDQLKQISAAVSKTVFSLFNTMGTNLLKVLTGGLVFFNIISLVLITPVVLFYVLRDWVFVEKKMADLIPLNKKEEVNSVFKEINTALSGFIRGQASVCLLLGLFYGVCLSLIGLDSGLLVGFLSGILSFIPYFGFLTGVILSCLLALVQQASASLWIGIGLVFLIGQILESYILTPKLVGNKVGLHPVWVIFSLLAGGALFGFVGVFVAVPVAAIIGVFVRRILKWYRSTPVYLSMPKGAKKKK